MEAGTVNKNIIEVNNLEKIFKTNRENISAVNDVSFSIKEGQCLGLIGESGSGKSTVANIITGFIKPSCGEVIFLGKPLEYGHKRAARQGRKDMQIIFQNPVSSFEPHMRVLDSVCEGLRYYNPGMPKEKMQSIAMKMLLEVGIPPLYYNRRCGQLSGGECQRVAIARAVVNRPKFIILDEVTSALDVSIQSQIMWILRDLNKRYNLSYLFISHDLAIVAGICDQILVMKEGNIVERGDTLNILNNPKHQYTRQLIDSILTI